jgi:lipoyl(octanoyl) transferase
MVSICHPQWLGQMEYGAALDLQKELVAQRAANEIPNTLLLLEHPHTYTIGIDGHREHLLVSGEKLAELNVAFQRVDRGGSVTYHGPGQLVCYPILNLQEQGLNYHRYLKMLESVVIHTLAALKVRAFRERGQPGVWVCPNPVSQPGSEWLQSASHIAQIAAIGVKLHKNHVTSHGFSINIDPDLSFFDLIVPCGLNGCRITSLAKILNKSVEISSVLEPVIQSFCQIFEMELLTMAAEIPELMIIENNSGLLVG